MLAPKICFGSLLWWHLNREFPINPLKGPINLHQALPEYPEIANQPMSSGAVALSRSALAAEDLATCACVLAL